MFVHWGLYSQLGRHEWVMNRERIPVGRVREARRHLEAEAAPGARVGAAGQGRRHEVHGDDHQAPRGLLPVGHRADRLQRRRSAARGATWCASTWRPAASSACKIGFYYSLMDWHHPDGARCAKDEKARRRFLDFTHGCVRELMTNYGKIDILWYDVSWPLQTPAALGEREDERDGRASCSRTSSSTTARSCPRTSARRRSTSRGREEGRAWEACMTFNGSWGYMPDRARSDWHPVREVLEHAAQGRRGRRATCC